MEVFVCLFGFVFLIRQKYQHSPRYPVRSDIFFEESTTHLSFHMISLLYKFHYRLKLYILAAQMGWSVITTAGSLLEHTAYFSVASTISKNWGQNKQVAFVYKNSLIKWSSDPPGGVGKWVEEQPSPSLNFNFTFDLSAAPFEDSKRLLSEELTCCNQLPIFSLVCLMNGVTLGVYSKWWGLALFDFNIIIISIGKTFSP